MRVRLFILILLSTLLVQSCEWMYPTPQPQRYMVLYYAAAHNNNLGYAISNNINDIKEGYLPAQSDTNNVVIVYYHLPYNAPRLSRFSKNDNGEFVEDILMDYPGSQTMPTYSLEDISIAQVIADAQTVYPSTRQSIIFSTHGSSFFPEGYSLEMEKESTKAVGPDDDIDIGINSLASALKGYHFDMIVFDCCFMGGIETAFELADFCDYVVASPTEIMTKGFVRSDTMEPLFTMSEEESGIEICKRYMTHVRSESAYLESGSIGLYKTSKLPELASACADIFYATGTKAYEIDTKKIQPYHRTDDFCFYDLNDFVKKLLTNEGVTNPLFDTFSSALSDVVIFKDSTPTFQGLKIDIDKFSGISSYIPRSEYSILNEYYTKLKWNKATGLVK